MEPSSGLLFFFPYCLEQKVQHSWRALLSKRTNHEESVRSCGSYENTKVTLFQETSRTRGPTTNITRMLQDGCVFPSYLLISTSSFQGYWAAAHLGGQVRSLVWLCGWENRRVVSEFGTRSSPFRWHALRSRLTSATSAIALTPESKNSGHRSDPLTPDMVFGTKSVKTTPSVSVQTLLRRDCEGDTTRSLGKHVQQQRDVGYAAEFVVSAQVVSQTNQSQHFAAREARSCPDPTAMLRCRPIQI